MRSLTHPLQTSAVVVAAASLLLAGCTSGSKGTGGTAPTKTTTSSSSSTPVTTTTPAGSTSSTSTSSTSAPVDGIPGSLGSIFAHAAPTDITPYRGDRPSAQFDSPSANIQCLIVDEDGTNAVSCTIKQYDFTQPGPDCTSGAVVKLAAAGAPQYGGCSTTAFTTTGDTVLPYNKSLQSGGIACVSASAGVTCLDLKTGAGFTLSKQAMQLVPATDTAPITCPSASTLTQAWNQAHQTEDASSVLGIDCTRTWAVAALNAAGNTVTAVFQLISGSWQAVDRAAPCEDHTVPAAIYQEACETN